MKKLASFKKLTKHSLFRSGVSGMAAVLMSWYLLPVELAVISLVVLFCHELTHFIIAYLLGGKPDWPLFIPIGFLLVGWTKIKDLDIDKVSAVALSGPIVGVVLSLFALILGWVLGSPIVMVGATVSCLSELYAGTLGSDGRSARKWHRIANLKKGTPA